MLVLTSILLSNLATSALAAPANYCSSRKRATGTKYLFVFGDSYSKTGYSWTSDSQPSAANPLGNPGVGSGTASGGYNWVDYLATKYNNSLLYTFDAAIGGSTVDQNIIDSKGYDSTASDFPGELSSWTSNNKERAPDWNGDNALFAVWFGVNDVHVGYSNGDIDSLYERDITALFSNVKSLYNAGARQFAILNLPPVSRAPEVMALGSADLKKVWQAETVWTDTLKSYFDVFVADHPNANAKLVDAKSAFDKVLNSPGSYDLPDSTCTNSDGTSCPWYNGLHPGIVIHKQVAEVVAGEFSAFFS